MLTILALFFLVFICFIGWLLYRKKEDVWAGLSAIGTIGAVVIALFLPELQGWYQRPILQMKFPQYVNEYLRWGNIYGTPQGYYYVDVELKNIGRSVAQNCQPLLTAMWEKKDRKWQKESNWVPIGLRWTLDQGQGGLVPRATEEKNLIQERPYIFSLGSVEESNLNLFMLSRYLIPTGQREKFTDGEYCFEITAYATDAKPAIKYFYVNWKSGYSKDINEFKKKLNVKLSNRMPR